MYLLYKCAKFHIPTPYRFFVIETNATPYTSSLHQKRKTGLSVPRDALEMIWSQLMPVSAWRRQLCVDLATVGAAFTTGFVSSWREPVLCMHKTTNIDGDESQSLETAWRWLEMIWSRSGVNLAPVRDSSRQSQNDCRQVDAKLSGSSEMGVSRVPTDADAEISNRTS